MAEKAKLAWQTLKADDTKLPESLRQAVATYEMARDMVHEEVNKTKTPPKGKRWNFSHKFGVAIALADSNNSAVDYFA